MEEDIDLGQGNDAQLLGGNRVGFLCMSALNFGICIKRSTKTYLKHADEAPDPWLGQSQAFPSTNVDDGLDQADSGKPPRGLSTGQQGSDVSSEFVKKQCDL